MTEKFCKDCIYYRRGLSASGLAWPTVARPRNEHECHHPHHALDLVTGELNPQDASYMRNVGACRRDGMLWAPK